MDINTPFVSKVSEIYREGAIGQESIHFNYGSR